MRGSNVTSSSARDSAKIFIVKTRCSPWSSNLIGGVSLEKLVRGSFFLKKKKGKRSLSESVGLPSV